MINKKTYFYPTVFYLFIPYYSNFVVIYPCFPYHTFFPYCPPSRDHLSCLSLLQILIGLHCSVPAPPTHPPTVIESQPILSNLVLLSSLPVLSYPVIKIRTVLSCQFCSNLSSNAQFFPVLKYHVLLSCINDLSSRLVCMSCLYGTYLVFSCLVLNYHESFFVLFCPVISFPPFLNCLVLTRLVLFL